MSANPLQAAGASALSFVVGAALPLLIAVLSPEQGLVWTVGIASLLFLALLGGLAAYAGGANTMRGILRVTFWGVLAMAITSGVGALFGTVS